MVNFAGMPVFRERKSTSPKLADVLKKFLNLVNDVVNGRVAIDEFNRLFWLGMCHDGGNHCGHVGPTDGFRVAIGRLGSDLAGWGIVGQNTWTNDGVIQASAVLEPFVGVELGDVVRANARLAPEGAVVGPHGTDDDEPFDASLFRGNHGLNGPIQIDV